MCGIAGFSGDFEPALLATMNDAIRHRGPDDAGELFIPEHRVGLAHRRLSIIDLSAAGRQPMWDVTRTVCISFNGEIYNFRELRKSLERDGFAFGNHTDTEVILNLYLRDGADCLTQLSGIFAFALWDSRTASLLVARDGLGVKPLYLSESSRGVVFASELKAVLRERSVSRALDADALRQYTRFLWCPAPQTILSSVRKLEPGHATTIVDGRVTRAWQFYELPFSEMTEPTSIDDAIASTRDVIARAVERQMVADVPVGAFLSGGLDSTSVVAFARAHVNGAPLRCFTIGFTKGTTGAEGIEDDLPYARLAAEALGVELEEVSVSPPTMDDLESMVYQLDEPQADLAPFNVGYICRAARAAGVTVLLSGAGGDDIFSGYRRHLSLGLEPMWSWLPRPARLALRAVARQLPTSRPALRRAAKVFTHAHRTPDDRIAAYFYWLDPETGDSLFAGDVLRDARPASGDTLLERVRSLPSTMPRLNKMLYLDTKFFLPDHNLNYTDKMSMAHGVEVRVPLLDQEVVAHAGRLPVEYKQRGGLPKWIFRKAMEGILPSKIIYRSKAGFGVPLRDWMKASLAPLIDEVLSERSLEHRGVYSAPAVRKLVELDRRGAIDAAYPILSMACTELWCRRFLDAA
jgi:asparagine synthase (glutamine-hydrolyzing)